LRETKEFSWLRGLNGRRTKVYKKRSKFQKLAVCLLTFVLFCQFTNIAALAIPIKVKKNTLDLSRNFLKPLPKIPQKEKSQLARKILSGDLVQPQAVRELNHSLKSIRDVVGRIEEKISRGDNPAVQIKYLQAKYESLKSLDKKVRNNLSIRRARLKEQKAPKATLEKSANLFAHYDKNINPVLNRLEDILKQKTNAYEDKPLNKIGPKGNFFGSILEFKNYFDDNVKLEPEKPELAPSPPTFRPANFKPIKPDTSGKVVPAYILQKSRKIIETAPQAIPQTTPQTLSSGSTTTAEGSIGVLSAAPPNPEDTQETIDVVITPEMQDLVASLNNSPARIFEWVKHNIEVEFYYGSMKGSRGAFLERAGNDIDTVSLLLALYRAANIPCRYVAGTIELPIENAKNLTGVDIPQKLGALLASAGIPTTLMYSGDEVVAVRIEHTWAEALVDYDPFAGAKAGEGDLWVPLSPWYKPHEYTDTVDLVQVSGFNTDTFLDDFISDVKPESPLDLFKGYMDDYLKDNNPGLNWQDGLRTRKTIPERFRTLPNTLNFTVVSVNGEYAELPDNLRHKVTINVPQVSLSHTLNLSEVVGRKVTYSYPPADEASRNLINSSGGIENVDPLAVNLLPSLKIEGVPVATGNVVDAGYYHSFRTTFNVPGQGSDFVEYSVISGAYYAVGLDPQLVSNKFLLDRIAEYISTMGDVPETTDNMDEITGEALYLAVMRYFNDVNTGDRIFAQSLKDVFLKQTSGAMTGKSLVVYTLFGTPSDLAPGGYFVDAKRNIYTPISVSGDDSRELDFMILGGYESSYHEHNLFEEFFHLEAISTIKLLSLASEQGMPVYDIDSSNINSILPLLGLDSSVKSAIQSAVSAGHIVKVHQDFLTVENWSGAGYIDLDPTTNAAGYIISGGWAGGSTVGEGGEIAGGPGSGPTAGDPVNIANGNLFHTEEDLAVPAVGIPIVFKRHYNSMVSYNGPFGYGWSYTYDEKITEDSGDESLTYTGGDGALFLYTRNPDETYKRPPGIYSTLIKNASGYVLTEKHGTKHIFDAAGKLTQLVDRNGNTVIFSYTGDNLTTITDPAGRDFTLAYNVDDKIESITAPGENTWTYTYDGDDLASVTNNANQTVSYTYYADHKMASRTNAVGGTVTFDYYSDGKTHTNLLPNGGTYLFSYNAPLRVTTVTDPEGNSTVHYYNDQGLTTGHLDPLGFEEIYEYDENLNRIKTIDKKGGITKNTFDDMGNLLSTTNQLNHTTTYAYEPVFNQPTSATDPMGNVSTNTYDVNGNLITNVDPDGMVTEYEYYTNGLVKIIEKSGQKKTEYTYFPDGNMETMQNAYGNISSMTYDALGRLTSRTDPNGNTTVFLLDKAGNIVATTDAESNQTLFTYNSLNLRTSIVDANGYETTYEYNNWGKLTKVRDPLGYEKIFTYNLNYDLQSEIDKNGNLWRYEYTSLNKLFKTIYNDGSEDIFSYDPCGNLVSVVDRIGTIQSEYDANNQLIKTIDVFNNEIKYTYYANGKRKTMIDPQGGITSYEYYNGYRIKSITNPQGEITEYIYGNGLLEKINYPNGTETNYTYDLNDRILTMVNKKTGGDTISSFQYEYDNVGNRSSMSDNEGLHSYQYDKKYQVVRVDYPDGSYRAYTYDPVGSRLTMTTATEVVNYSYDKNNRLLSAGSIVYEYDDNGNQVRRTDNSGITQYVYDLKNRLIEVDYADGSSEYFTYNALGQRVSKKSGTQESNYSYDRMMPLMELNGNGVVHGYYTNGPTGIISKKDSLDNVTYFLKDAIGSVTELSDDVGEVKASYSYDIFGKVRSAAVIDEFNIRQRFVGKSLSVKGDLYYFGARYYDPSIGRFATPDILTWGPDDPREVGGVFDYYFLMGFENYNIPGYMSTMGANSVELMNLYTYCANNPINFVDLYGFIAKEYSNLLNLVSIIFGVAGVALGAIALLLGATSLLAVAAPIIFGVASLIFAGAAIYLNPPQTLGQWLVTLIAVSLGVISLFPALGWLGIGLGVASIVLPLLLSRRKRRFHRNFNEAVVSSKLHFPMTVRKFSYDAFILFETEGLRYTFS
jgi:RHS repeat-associated protein